MPHKLICISYDFEGYILKINLLGLLKYGFKLSYKSEVMKWWSSTSHYYKQKCMTQLVFVEKATLDWFVHLVTDISLSLLNYSLQGIAGRVKLVRMQLCWSLWPSLDQILPCQQSKITQHQDNHQVWQEQVPHRTPITEQSKLNHCWNASVAKEYEDYNVTNVIWASLFA